MAMTDSGLADALGSAMDSIIYSDEVDENGNKKNKETTPSEANNTFWKTICDYVEENAEVEYVWVAKDGSGSPDPTTKWVGKIITRGSLSPCGETTPKGALESVSESMNSNVNTWTIDPPEGFDVSGSTITGSAINLKASNAKSRKDALLSISGDIIKGIKAAIPPVMSGSHSSYNGSTTSGKIS